MREMPGNRRIGGRSMRLAQARIVTDDVERAATFYASILGVQIFLNEYYVEVPAGDVTLGFCKARFTECGPTDVPQVILDFEVDDVDLEFGRLDALGVDWVQLPTTQPWGNRSMTFRGPEGVLLNVFSRPMDVADSPSCAQPRTGAGP